MSRVSINSSSLDSSKLRSLSKNEPHEEDISGSSKPKKRKFTTFTLFEEDDNSNEPPVGAIEKSESENPSQPHYYEYKSDITPIAVTLTDVEVFKCPVCIKQFTIPVHQCLNGHMVCDSCCQLMNKKCPTCSLPIEQRSWGIEKVLEAVQVSCRNSIYGCEQKMKFSEKGEHEDKCLYTSCPCPMYGCDFDQSATNLYQHFGKKHNGVNFRFNYRFIVPVEKETTYVFLRENTSGTIFVLKQFSVNETKALSVVLVAPKSYTVKYRYELEAKDGEELLSLKSAVARVTRLDDYSPAKYLLVVEDYLNPLGQLMLQIRICRAAR